MDASYYVNGKVLLMEDKRLGQLNWFSESDYPELFDKLNQRIETVSGFSTKTAEKFQIVNYGLGGHFDVHIDAFSDVCDFFQCLGNIQNISIQLEC